MSILDQHTAKVLATICAFVAIVAFLYLSIPVVATIRIVWVRWQKYSAVIATAATQGDIPGLSVK